MSFNGSINDEIKEIIARNKWIVKHVPRDGRATFEGARNRVRYGRSDVWKEACSELCKLMISIIGI